MAINMRHEPTVKMFLGELANTPLPTIEEELELAEGVSKGVEKAIEEYKLKNTCFVAAVAKKYINRGLSQDELMEAGYNGLIEAAKRYDANLGIRFIPFVVWWIRRGVLEALSAEV